MKKLLLSILFVAIFATIISAQKKIIDLTKEYNRNNVSFLILRHPDKYDDLVVDNYLKIDLSNKYNINTLKENTISVKYGRDENTALASKAERLAEYFNNQNYGKEIISYWFDRQPDGSMDMKRVGDRGQYNATDNKVLAAEASKRGSALLKDEGIRLINKSYIIVLDVRGIAQSVSTSMGIMDYVGVVDTYLFSVDYNQDLQNKIFQDCWFDKDEQLTQDQKDAKNNAFNNLTFKIKYERATTANIQPPAGQQMFTAFVDVMNSNNLNKTYTGDGIAEFTPFMDRAFTASMVSLENVRPDFIVRTGIFSTHPIEAKIGKKEGLKRNQMYDVYEAYLDESSNQVVKKVAVLRATKVRDNTTNATGNSLTSKFTIISKKKRIEPGMYIQQRNDQRMTLYLDYTKGTDLAVYSLGVSNINFITTGGFAGSLLIDICVASNAEVTSNSRKDNTSFCLRMGYAFRFNLLFMKNLKIEPYAIGGAGFSFNEPETTTTNQNTGEETMSINEFTFSYGAKLILNLSYPLQVYLKAENNTFLSGELNVPSIGAGIQYSF